MLDTNYDPYEVLLTLQAQYEQLSQQNQRMIEVINHQTQCIQAQAHFIEQFDKRIKQLEQELL